MRAACGIPQRLVTFSGWLHTIDLEATHEMESLCPFLELRSLLGGKLLEICRGYILES